MPQTTSPKGKPEHELDAPPWLRVESTLMAAAKAIRDAYDERLARLGLNLSLASLLAYTDEYGAVSQTRVAQHLGQGRAVTGSNIDRLASLGLVERRPDPDDRRVWLVAVTEEGRATAEQVKAVDFELRAELRVGVSREERQMLATLLLRLQQNLDNNLRDSSKNSTTTARGTA